MFAAVFGTIITASFIDDGAILLGGVPVLMKGHPTVRMVAERVYIQVTKSDQIVDCWFVFKNDGAERTVTMGFPNIGSPDYVRPKRKTKGAQNFESLRAFRSSVDGKPAIVTRVKGDEPGESWFVKKVFFARKQTRQVHVSYACPLGIGATNSGGYIREINYLMNTGSSWKGPIESARVTVEFKNGQPLPLELREVPEDLNPYLLKNWKNTPKNRLLYKSFAKPSVRGRSITFQAWNIDPEENVDDIQIYFGFRTVIPGVSTP